MYFISAQFNCQQMRTGIKAVFPNTKRRDRKLNVSSYPGDSAWPSPRRLSMATDPCLLFFPRSQFSLFSSLLSIPFPFSPSSQTSFPSSFIDWTLKTAFKNHTRVSCITLFPPCLAATGPLCSCPRMRCCVVFHQQTRCLYLPICLAFSFACSFVSWTCGIEETRCTLSSLILTIGHVPFH